MDETSSQSILSPGKQYGEKSQTIDDERYDVINRRHGMAEKKNPSGEVVD